MVIISYTGSP